MNSWKKSLGAALAGALLAASLAGCSPKEAAKPNDICYRTAGIAYDSTLAKVDGTAVPADEYLYFLNRSILLAKENGYLANDAAWEEKIGDTLTADYLKQDALDTVALLVNIQAKAVEQGVTLGESDKKEIESQISKLADLLSTQGLTLQQGLDMYCVTEATYRQVFDLSYLSTALQEKMTEPGGELEPTDERVSAFVEEVGIYSAKHILLSTVKDDGTAFSDAEKAAVKAEADALVAGLRSADDPLALFDQKMEERSDDRNAATGALNGPDGYTATPGQMVPEFEAGAKALTVGQISDPIESRYGYHIILRQDAVNTDTKRQFSKQRMNELLQQWVDASEVETTPAYGSLDPKAFYDNLQAVIKEYQAAGEAALQSATPEASGTPAASPAGA